MTGGSRSPAAATYRKPKLPLKVRLSISLLSAIKDATRRADGTINRRLLSFLNLRAPPNPTTVHCVRTIDLTVDPARKLWFRLFLPGDGRPQRLPLIVFFHAADSSISLPTPAAMT
ncbi:hypothetical protein KFK09_024442 [Dendrobium nobile]|uniref:Uncharacterized protein n=1 Tax=Dendrobium nobile TaxID=94219 RepID=A0A8T3ADS5_DENNO|nr:hypothetical protein KFK09_024442 [Dendrobium nobile]